MHESPARRGWHSLWVLKTRAGVEGSIAMKRQLFGLAASLAFASALVAAQATSKVTPQTQPQQKDHAVTLTGCLIQGSSPTVFLLDNARENPKSTMEKSKSYKLASAAEDLNFSKNLNHEVRVTGTPDQMAAATPPAGQKATEKDLPTLRAQSITSVADTCTSAGQ
jgi:hypothetical protein